MSFAFRTGHGKGKVQIMLSTSCERVAAKQNRSGAPSARMPLIWSEAAAAGKAASYYVYDTGHRSRRRRARELGASEILD